MIPVALDPKAVRLAVVGRGEAALRRYRSLLAGGAADTVLFCDMPDEAAASAAGSRLRPVLPHEAALRPFGAVWITGLPEALAAEIAARARAAGVLVNVEDVTELCDFHSVAQVRRGDLLVTVSTGGKSPGLAAHVRRHLERSFDDDWSRRVDALGAHRARWREEGRPPAEIASLTDAAVETEGWLP